MTSPRRLHRGLLYNLFVTCIYYYLLAYILNRVARRVIIGTAPHIRDLNVGRQRSWLVTGGTVGCLVVLAFLGLKHFHFDFDAWRS